jgi:F-type H+-transporting ATPase subunit gamma
MAVGKEIRTKISSIQNTQKITSAMEMVAASKMRKAQERMAVGKPYARRMRSVVGHIANAAPEYQHMYMQEREVKRVGYIVVSTDRGLCGGLNGNLFKATIRSMKEWADQDIEIDLSLIGAKAGAFFGSYGGNVTAAVRDIGEAPAIADLIGAVKAMLDAYADGKIDKLFLVSNQFVNTMSQDPTVEQLLPLVAEESTEMKHHWDYIYEPDATELL